MGSVRSRPRIALCIRVFAALSWGAASACASNPATAPDLALPVGTTEVAPSQEAAPFDSESGELSSTPDSESATAASSNADGPDALPIAWDDDFDDEFDDALEPLAPDPLEPINRGIFRGNRVLDRFLWQPIAQGYGWLMPDPAKRSVRNFFENLNEPVVLVNDLLQCEGSRAGTAGTRFLVNSTVGIVGLFDPAQRWGFEPHVADFGQTLGKAGLGPGVYLVVPVLGPSTARDLVGGVVDLALRIDNWLLPLGGNLLIGGTGSITVREEVQDELSALESSSVDFYVSVRGAYLMSRAALVRDRASDREDSEPASEEMEPEAPVDGDSAPAAPAEQPVSEGPP